MPWQDAEMELKVCSYTSPKGRETELFGGSFSQSPEMRGSPNPSSEWRVNMVRGGVQVREAMCKGLHSGPEILFGY